jgi:hypothetical protein
MHLAVGSPLSAQSGQFCLYWMIYTGVTPCQGPPNVIASGPGNVIAWVGAAAQAREEVTVQNG